MSWRSSEQGTRRVMAAVLCGVVLLGWGCGGQGGSGDADAGDEVDVGGEGADVSTGVDACDAAGTEGGEVPAPKDTDVADGGRVEPPLYRTDGKWIRDRLGRAILLRGVNIATGDLEEWEKVQPGAMEKAFVNIAKSGFNAVRLVINWDRIEPEQDGYDEGYVALVEGHVRTAAKWGLYVVVDMHQDLYGIGFGLHGAPLWSCDESNYESFVPREPWFLNYFSEEVAACFDHLWQTPELRAHQQSAARAVAARVADVELVIGFDPFNEPAPGTLGVEEFEAQWLRPFYEEFAAVVGEALPERLYFVEPTAMFSVLCSTGLTEALPFAAVLAPHYYNPSVETEKLWDEDEDAVGAAVGCGVAAAQGLGIPLAYGELGGASETPNLTGYLLALSGELDAAAAGSFLWIYSKQASGFGLVDQETGQWGSHAAAYLRPAPSVVGGTPGSFSWDTGTGLFELEWESTGEQGTEVLLPAWVEAAGMECWLDGEKLAPPEKNDAGTRLMLPALPAGKRTFKLQVLAPYPTRQAGHCDGDRGLRRLCSNSCFALFAYCGRPPPAGHGKAVPRLAGLRKRAERGVRAGTCTLRRGTWVAGSRGEC